jgi:hypothetical protein
MKKKHFIGKPLIGWPKKVDHYTTTVRPSLSRLNGAVVKIYIGIKGEKWKQ